GPVDDSAGRPVVRVVQGNISQAEKSRRANIEVQIGTLIALSRRPGFDKLAAVVWPETAIPFVVTPSSPALPTLSAAAPPGGYLLAGALRGTDRPEDGVWNSLLAIARPGTIAAFYDKVHLVPFGEYIPLHKEIAPLTGLVGRG